MSLRIALVGGGAAALSMLGALLHRADDIDLQIDWFCGTSGKPPRGVAYGTTSPRHLLNVRASNMGLLPAQPDGFADLAREHLPDASGDDFLPRALYGDFLHAQMIELWAQAEAASVPVRQIAETVDAVHPDAQGAGVEIVCASGSTRCDAAVLALGGLPTRPLKGVSDQAVASGAYIVDPWAFLAAPQRESPPREVTIIGMGLSAVDVVLELSARWPQAHFTMISRHGHLPAAHRALRSESCSGVALIESMLARPRFVYWMQQVRHAMAQTGDWRSVMDALRPQVVTLWLALPIAERQRFLRHGRWAWDRVRHRMAPPVAAGLADLETQGRLIRLAARLHAVMPGHNRLDVTLRPRGQAAQTLRHSDLVIQTTGLDSDLRHTSHALARQLLDQGHVLPDPLGLGFQAERHGELRHASGTWPQLYALGSLMRGTLWESLAIPDIRKQADALAAQIMANHYHRAG